MSDLPLEGKRALVTGAGRGIGKATALALAEAGARVALVARGRADLGAAAAEVRTVGAECHLFVCDVTDAEQVASMAASALEALGGLDILVNNAGSAASHKFIGHPDELWHRMISSNLTSTYLVSKAFVPSMVEQHGGRIINVASVAAKVGERYVAAYTAAKHGVLGLTRSLAAELVTYGITVNAVCPGYVDTALTEKSIANITARTGLSADEARGALERTNPQNRLISAEEVAAAIVFLALPLTRGINGQALNIDGGSVTF